MASTANGAAILDGSVMMPRTGAWVATLRIESEKTLPVSARGVTLSLEGQTFVGTVLRQSVYAGALDVTVVAGANGLGTALAAKKYQGVPVSIPLQDVLTGAGETLSSTSDAGKLALFLQFWTRAKGTAGSALAQLLFAAGATWRIVPDGSMYVGTGITRAATLAAGEAVLGENGSRGARHISLDSAHVLPGDVVESQTVAAVKYRISPQSFAAVVWT